MNLLLWFGWCAVSGLFVGMNIENFWRFLVALVALCLFNYAVGAVLFHFGVI